MTAFEIVPGVTPTDLVDTSALARVRHHPGVSSALLGPLKRGLIAHCEVTRLEMGMTARNMPEHRQLGELLDAMPQVPVTAADYARAWEVQGFLAGRGMHRGIAVPDLLVAACAERLGLTVVHCDADFDLISAVTGQPTRWAVAPDQL
jgi:predicted nucleic acid-binding protein